MTEKNKKIKLRKNGEFYAKPIFSTKSIYSKINSRRLEIFIEYTYLTQMAPLRVGLFFNVNPTNEYTKSYFICSIFTFKLIFKLIIVFNNFFLCSKSKISIFIFV